MKQRIDKLTPALIKRLIKEEKQKINLERKAIELKESRKLLGALKLYKQVKESKKSSPKLLKILKSYIKERK